MFFRLLMESFRRQRRRKALAGIAILLGTTAVTAMLALATTIGDRIHRELAVYGANIVVTPQAAQLDVKIGGAEIHPATGNAYLHESDLAKLKTIFWANNITGISPELFVDAFVAVAPSDISVPGKHRGIPFHRVSLIGSWFNHPFGNASNLTGLVQMHPAWKVTGVWPSNPNEAVAGTTLAKELGLKPGADLIMSDSAPEGPDINYVSSDSIITITGIVDTGDDSDSRLFAPLSTVQSILGNSNAVSRIEIAARTKPEDAFARQDPDKLSPAQHEIWYCRPYANSIAYQIQEAIPGAHAEQVRQVEQTEGTVLERISGLMWLISAAALLAAGFAVSAAMATAILERRAEIGLMRSLGAAKSAIALLFYAETGLLAIFAGILGYLLGSGLAAWLGARIFPDATANTLATTLASAFNPVLLPVVVGLALLVALAGSTPAIRSALRLDPSAILRADA